jgi:hypothetical protein
MPKKVKTRKQKKLIDLRLKNTTPAAREADYTTYSLPIPNSPKDSVLASSTSSGLSAKTRSHVITADYKYLTFDLHKTILLTLSIIAAELFAKYYLKI